MHYDEHSPVVIALARDDQQQPPTYVELRMRNIIVIDGRVCEYVMPIDTTLYWSRNSGGDAVEHEII